MKQQFLNYFILGGLLLLFTLSSCKKTYDLNLCTEGYVLEGDDCICPEGLIEWRYQCLELKDVLGDKFKYFVEFSEDCACLDKFALSFENYFENLYGDTLRAIIVKSEYGGGAGFMDGCFYEEKWDGDEISIGYNGATLSIGCADGTIREVKARGKFNSDNTEMTLEWIWLKNYTTPIDTCIATFRKS